MNKRKWAALALALTIGLANAAEPVAFDTTVKITVDSTGTPTAVQAVPELPELVRVQIERAVSAWRFAPPSLDGAAVTGTTYVQLGACAMPTADGGMNLSAAYRSNGPETLGKEVPRFPTQNRQALLENKAEFLVEYTVGKDGKATLEDIKKTTGSAKALGIFAPTLREWVTRLRFKPEELAGAPISTRMRTPVSFSSTESRLAPSPEVLRRQEQEKKMMSPECIAAAGRQPATGLESYAINSPLKFLGPG